MHRHGTAAELQSDLGKAKFFVRVWNMTLLKEDCRRIIQKCENFTFSLIIDGWDGTGIFDAFISNSLLVYLCQGGYVIVVVCLLWSPYVTGQTITFSSCFFLLLLLFFSSPNLSGRRLDVYHTLAHGVALVRI